jgi:hypothetical protein
MKDTASANRPLSTTESFFAVIDFGLGGILVGLSLLLIATSFLPLPTGHDNAIIGLLGGIATLPFGLAALAAGQAIRRRSRGRWVLQALAAVPVLALGWLLATL